MINIPWNKKLITAHFDKVELEQTQRFKYVKGITKEHVHVETEEQMKERLGEETKLMNSRRTQLLEKSKRMKLQLLTKVVTFILIGGAEKTNVAVQKEIYNSRKFLAVFHIYLYIISSTRFPFHFSQNLINSKNV